MTEAARFDEGQIQDWMQRARRLLSRYRSHPQFDDLLATCYRHMWEALRHATGPPGRDHTALAMQGVRYGLGLFLRSPENVTSQRTQRDNERAELLSLTDWRQLRSRDGSALAPPVTPDFVPPLLTRLLALDAWERLEPTHRRALWLGCIKGLSRAEIAAELGLPRPAVESLLKGVWVIPSSHLGPVEANRKRALAPYCRHGHPRTSANLTPHGRCRTCVQSRDRERARQRYAREKQERPHA